MVETSYSARGSATGQHSGGQAAPDKPGTYWPLSKLKKAYSEYLTSKRDEIEEQKEALRYYHGSQWTAEQLRILKKRRQPHMTFNRISRKIDGVCGLIEKMRQDPKAYARTPQHEEGAELATAAVRYVLDQSSWKDISSICAQNGAVEGIGGVEVEIVPGDQGDPDISIAELDIASVFYDPRSFKEDFGDARYVGMGKWIDDDIAEEMFPDADADAFSSDDELVNNSDKDSRWFAADGVNKRVRIVDIWYKHKGGVCWAVFTGNAILMEGRSYLQDEKGEDYAKYILFSGNVDQDGDRYGFVRNMKSAQDGINAKQSKMQHMLASKRLILAAGAVDDVEKVRAEYARPDGVVVTNARNVKEGVLADDQTFDFTGMAKLLELNLAEIENFGPNPALIGQGIENKSGRAIALLQQAGIAELGPYIISYRGWKIRVYRAIWNAVKNHWRAERWIRVTDNEDLAQYIQINGMQTDPMTGQPTIVNAIGQLDVDMIMDEGPDNQTTAQDTYDALIALAQSGAQIPPDILIDLAPGIDSRTKKSFKERMEQAKQQPNPEVAAEQAKLQAQMQSEQMKIQANMQAKEAELVLKQKEHEDDLEFQYKSKAMDIEMKERELQINHAHEQQRMAMEHEHTTRQQEADFHHETRKAETGIQVEREKAHLGIAAQREKNAMDGDRDAAKHDATLKAKKDEKDHEAKAAEKGAEKQGEPFKPVVAALTKAADAMSEVAKAVGKPKKIQIVRDASGRATGGMTS